MEKIWFNSSTQEQLGLYVSHVRICQFFILIPFTESASFGDLIIGEFLDSYDNLPEKVFMAFQYFGNNCFWKKKKVLILQDTDCFVTLYDILLDYNVIQRRDQWGNKESTYPPLGGDHREALYCLRGTPLPTEDMIDSGLYSGKWWIKLGQWPPRYPIPKYCSGGCNR